MASSYTDRRDMFDIRDTEKRQMDESKEENTCQIVTICESYMYIQDLQNLSLAGQKHTGVIPTR